MPNKVILEWFDKLEEMLQREAELVGLLSHSSTIGQAREFLVTRVLRTILPTSVHIGSGMVIDHQGGTSKQIDIVLYDPRFPLIRVEGGGLYFVEGVLATIEVKSTIDAEKLRDGLDNCKSVLTLQVNGEYPEEKAAQTVFYSKAEGIPVDEAEQRFWYRFHPATYIFAFNSKLTAEATVKEIRAWWQANEFACSAHFPLLPRIIATGNAVGVVNDGWITIHPDTGPAPTTPKTNKAKSHRVLSVFPTDKRFRWVALHLMNHVSARLGLRNYAEKSEYRVSSYFPLQDYPAHSQGANAFFIDLAHDSTEKK